MRALMARGSLLSLALVMVACDGTDPVLPGDGHGEHESPGTGEGDASLGDGDGPSGDGDAPARDGGSPRADGGAPPVDGGSEDLDGGVRDGGVPGDGDGTPGDAGQSWDDDAGSSDEDAGTPPQSFVGFYDNVEGMPLVAMIDAALSTIDLEVYEMMDSGVHTALKRALERGVRVRVVAEPKPVGSSCRPFTAVGASESAECLRIKNLIALVQESGGAYVPFDKEALCEEPTRCYQHGKLGVFDGRLVLVSTGNFNSTSLCNLAASPPNCNRDYTIVTEEAEVVGVLAQVFERDLTGEPYDLAELIAPVAGRVTVSPLSLEPLLSFIASAQTSIHIANQYFHEPDINQALVDAAERGVSVQLTFSSFCFFGRPSNSEVTKETEIFEAFDAAGIRSRAFTSRQQVGGQAGYMHAKAIVVDEARAWVGSVNGSVAATSKNREFGLFFATQSWLDTLLASLNDDFAHPDSESWEESLACAKDDPVGAP